MQQMQQMQQIQPIQMQQMQQMQQIQPPKKIYKYFIDPSRFVKKNQNLMDY